MTVAPSRRPEPDEPPGRRSDLDDPLDAVTHGAALPVAVDVAGPQDEVRHWVEGVLGWQPVDAATSTLVPAAVRLTDVAAAEVGTGGAGPVPTVLLVTDEATPVEVARAGARLQPAAVVAWPTERDRLGEVVDAMLAEPRPIETTDRLLRVGGTAGGVGTTTVTLALAGLAAWRGARTLAVLRDPALVPDVRRVPAPALASHDLWERASELPGCRGVRAVSVPRDTPAGLHPTGQDVEVVVVDGGVDLDADVLVGRADAAGLDALAAATAGALVVVADGPASPKALARACGRRRVVRLPWSQRVARAGLQGRVPAGLPGAWLRRLAPLAPR